MDESHRAKHPHLSTLKTNRSTAGVRFGDTRPGKLTKNDGKSPFLMGKSTINGPFSLANCCLPEGIHRRGMGLPKQPSDIFAASNPAYEFAVTLCGF